MRLATASTGEPVRNRPEARPLLTVVVPVYNGGPEVVSNIEAIRDSVVAGLRDEDVEVVVVSDGSIDGTAEALLESRSDRVRVIHYDRNLGKGYAVRAGAMASRGEWVALVDADLDLDPRSIPQYLAAAERERLDFAIGSKRHAQSVVSYPRSRRIASWSYQQLNRLLFRLDVRDTQVGLKVFSRRVVDDVMPLLLVKRFAFDLELLVVARALGYTRIKEFPVRLDYKFTGSAVRSRAALRALLDTVAIFYRLRILRTYERKRRLMRGGGGGRPSELPTVSLVANASAAALLDYPHIDLVTPGTVETATSELVAVLAPGARPAGNWVTAAVPFFADQDVAAVVVPTLAPLRAPLSERVAAAVLESRLGGGSRRAGHFPGNVRFLADGPAESVVIRRPDFSAARAAGIDDEALVAWLASRGRRTLYTPDAFVAAAPEPIVRPHLAGVLRHARARGVAARRSRGRSLSAASALSLAPAAAALVGAVLLLAGGTLETVGLGLLLAYGAALAVSGIHAAMRFRSAAVGLLEPLVVVATHGAYLVGFARGLVAGAA